MTTNPDPSGADQPATVVQVEIRSLDGETAYLTSEPLDDAALADLLDQVAPGAKPAAEVTVPTAAGVVTVKAWRIRSIVALPSGAVLYERRREPVEAAAGRVNGRALCEPATRTSEADLLDYWAACRQLDELVPGWSRHHSLATAVEALTAALVRWAGADQITAELDRIGDAHPQEGPTP